MESVDRVSLAGELDKASRYRELAPQLASLFDGEPDLIANLANAAAALKRCIRKASWVGFYVVREGSGPSPEKTETNAELVLGPFQGNVACVRIAFGKGVCGFVAQHRRTIIVPDVDQFAGHIACDAGSRSEIVLPIFQGDRLVAVLDVDSYELAAFDDLDAAGLAPIAKLLGTLAW
jgi:GAF domain-containing protein